MGIFISSFFLKGLRKGGGKRKRFHGNVIRKIDNIERILQEILLKMCLWESVVKRRCREYMVTDMGIWIDNLVFSN